MEHFKKNWKSYVAGLVLIASNLTTYLLTPETTEVTERVLATVNGTCMVVMRDEALCNRITTLPAETAAVAPVASPATTATTVAQ